VTVTYKTRLASTAGVKSVTDGIDPVPIETQEWVWSFGVGETLVAASELTI
jgi:hypothetical protein